MLSCCLPRLARKYTPTEDAIVKTNNNKKAIRTRVFAFGSEGISISPQSSCPFLLSSWFGHDRQSLLLHHPIVHPPPIGIMAAFSRITHFVNHGKRPVP